MIDSLSTACIAVVTKSVSSSSFEITSTMPWRNEILGHVQAGLLMSLIVGSGSTELALVAKCSSHCASGNLIFS